MARGPARTPTSLLLPMQLQQMTDPRVPLPRALAGRGPSLSHPGFSPLSGATRSALSPILQVPGSFGPGPDVGGLPEGPPAGNVGSDMGPDGMPAPPAVQRPTLLAMPEQGLAVRAASALADTPAYSPLPFESAGSAIGRGPLSGAARGFAGSTLSDYSAKAAGVATENKTRQAAADEANHLATETYLKRYGAALDDRGKIEVNQKIADDTGLPVGAKVTGDDIARARLAQQAQKDREASDPTVPVHDPLVAKVLGIEPGGTTRQSRYLEGYKAAHPNTTSGGNGAFGPGFDPVGIAQAIHEKNNAPDPSGFSRGQWGMIVSAWNKQFPGENLTQPIADWKSFTRNINTMQGSKFTAMGVNLEASDKAIALTRQYAASLADVAPQFANLPMNDLAQKVQQKFNFGGPQQQAAISRLIGQAEAIRLQLASLYMAGGAPTDQAMKHASEILNYKMPPVAFAAQLDVAQNDVRLRREAYFDAAQLKGVNPYGSPGVGGESQPASWHSDQPVQGWTKMTLNGTTEYVEPGHVAKVTTAGGKVAK